MRETLVKSEEFKDSPVGRVPKNWKVVNLASVCQRITDGSHQSVKTSDEGVPFLYVSCVRDGQILWEQAAKITETTYSEISKGREPKPGLILYTAVGSYGHAALVRENCKFSFQRHIAYILPNAESVAPEYLVRWLNSPQGRKYADQVALGNAQKTVTLSSLADFPVLLPSLEEQEGIAAILNSIDQAIAHTSSLIAKLKQMKAGLLHDLLTRGLDENGELRDAIGHPEQFKDSPLGLIPKDWEVLPLQNFTLSSAFGPRFSGNAYNADGNVATLRTTDMDDEGNLNLSTMPLARLNLDLYRSHFLEIGDLLVSRSGTCGITAVFPGFDIPVLPGAFVIRFRFKNGLLSEFVRRYFNWETGRERVLREAEGGVQKNLRGSTLLKLLIPVPVEAEQREILRRLDAHESRIRAEEGYRDKLKLQKQGLMHGLLTGKVRVKDA